MKSLFNSFVGFLVTLLEARKAASLARNGNWDKAQELLK